MLAFTAVVLKDIKQIGSYRYINRHKSKEMLRFDMFLLERLLTISLNYICLSARIPTNGYRFFFFFLLHYKLQFAYPEVASISISFYHHHCRHIAVHKTPFLRPDLFVPRRAFTLVVEYSNIISRQYNNSPRNAISVKVFFVVQKFLYEQYNYIQFKWCYT